MLLTMLFSIDCYQPIMAQQTTQRHRLFSDDMRQMQPSPVYDFLEQALYDYQTKRPDRELQLQKVVFTKGCWSLLATVRTDDACQLNTIDNRRYAVSWSRSGRELVSLHFPIDYELLAGSTRRKMERSFVSRLRSHQARGSNQAPVSVSSLKPWTGHIFVLPGAHFSRMKHITSDTYYTLTANGNTAVPVNDRQHPAETLANWLLTGSNRQARLSVSVSMSDNTTEQIGVTIAQWLSFCRAEGCTPYYIYESATAGSHRVMLVLDNPSKGYVHTLSIDCPTTQLSSTQPRLSARAYLFTPLSNVTDLFAKTPKGRSGKKTYE